MKVEANEMPSGKKSFLDRSSSAVGMVVVSGRAVKLENVGSIRKIKIRGDLEYYL